MPALRRSVATISGMVPSRVRRALRPIARHVGLAAAHEDWWLATTPPWVLPSDTERSTRAWCIICRWSGEHFLGEEGGEGAACPRCGAIARDRFFFWCFLRRTPKPFGLRVLETSPRLGERYKDRMRQWFDYRCSDLDRRAHRADLQLDLQAIELPSESLDIVLTPHVLEHVPDTAKALTELHRVLTPGGRMYLQVPLARGQTSVPPMPEFHEDHTPVFFNFGWDLTDLVREAGFDTRVLVPVGYFEMLHGRRPFPPSPAHGLDLDQLASAVRLHDLAVVMDDTQAAGLGIRPPFVFATWEAVRPSDEARAT
jgi:Methyltransferase domain